MNMQETIASQAKRLLTQLASQITTRVPSSLCRVGEQIVNSIPSVYASFLKSPDADTVDLSVEIRLVAEYVTVSADLVVGGSGRILSEMAAVTIRKDTEIEPALHDLEKYVLDQADTIVAELQ